MRLLIVLAGLMAIVVAPAHARSDNLRDRPLWQAPARITGTRGLDQAGPGAWITNSAGGYYLGRAYDGDRVAVLGPSADRLHVTVAVRPRRHPRQTFCGVVEKAALTSTAFTPAANPCRTVVGRLVSRRTVGRQFNCPPHVCMSGTYYTPPVENPWMCNGRFYANYLPEDSPYAFSATGEHGFFDERGPIHGNLHYRYTTRDGLAAVARDDDYGWGVVQRGCIPGTPLGGPPNPTLRQTT